MARLHLHFLRCLALLSIGMTTLAGAHLIDLRRIGALQGDANAGKERSAVCSACHGAAGIAPAPPFPNLAGQHAEYLYWQLVEFKHVARPDSVMTGQVANLDDTAMRDLATYFASLAPAPAPSAISSTSRGALLYRNGDPATGTPPCQGCHGVDATGNPLAATEPPYRVYPALRAQHADYIVQRLKDFRDGKHLTSSADRIMTPVARTLDEDSMKAVAAWLETGQ